MVNLSETCVCVFTRGSCFICVFPSSVSRFGFRTAALRCVVSWSCRVSSRRRSPTKTRTTTTCLRKWAGVRWKTVRQKCGRDDRKETVHGQKLLLLLLLHARRRAWGHGPWPRAQRSFASAASLNWGLKLESTRPRSTWRPRQRQEATDGKLTTRGMIEHLTLPVCGETDAVMFVFTLLSVSNSPL